MKLDPFQGIFFKQSTQYMDQPWISSLWIGNSNVTKQKRCIISGTLDDAAMHSYGDSRMLS